MARFSSRMAHAHRSFVREILKVTEDPSIISFAGGLPSPRMFPVKEVAAAAQKVLAEAGEAALQYAATEGFRPLREYIASRYVRRGMKVSVDEILITNGSQQGLDLIAKALLDSGDTVLVERPTYLAAIQAFGLFEPKFHALQLEEDGVRPEQIAAALASQAPKIFYAIPNFQNPSGISWSGERRRQAAALLSKSDTVLVEDDPYGELRFKGVELPPMGLAPDGSGPGQWAVLLGTFSKTVAPGLRIGWLCARQEIMERVIVAKQAADLHSNGLAQRVIHRYVTDNDVEKHIARIRAGLRPAEGPHGGDGRKAVSARGGLHEAQRRDVSLDDPAGRHVVHGLLRPGNQGKGRLRAGPGVFHRRLRSQHAAAELLQRG